MSIIKKLTIAYTVIIAIPTIIMGIYINNQFQKNIQYEIVESTQQTLLQIKDSINNKIFIAEKINSSVGYNSIVIDFLNKHYVLNKDTLETYMFYLRPLLTNTQYINQEDIYKVAIYTNNESIPELWEILYHESRINETEWYKSFIKGKVISRWILPNEGSSPENASKTAKSSNFTLVRKVYNSNGKYLGVISLNILQDEIFSAAKQREENVDNSFFVTDLNHKITYSTNSKYDPSFLLMDKHVKDTTNYFIDNNRLYTYETIDKMGIRIFRSSADAHFLK